MNKIMDRQQMLSAISIIPESAPFNEQQRAWLNGFFAGMTGIEEIPGGKGAAATNGSGVVAEPVVEEHFPWHDDSLSIDERLELAEGKPVKRQMMAAMAQLDCGSCGYLCQTYSEAIAKGEESNLTLCTPGGKETMRALKRLVKLEGDSASPASAAKSVNPETSQTNGYSRKNPFPAKLIRSEKLTGQGSAKDVRHVEIDLTGGDLEYEVGDALGLYPTNCRDLVDEILSHCDIDGDVDIAQEALITRDVATVTDELCDCIAAAVSSDVDQQRLQQLVDDEDQLDELDVLDMLQLFDSIQISENQLIECLPELNPRLYSIASSLKKHPSQVHLTVGKVSYTLGDRLRKGVASTMLADRVEPGGTLKVFTHKSHGFTVPQADDAPMIMVGPGTGIAPFIAFLQEREARNAPGKNWLFFGDQRSETDFLYHDQLMSYLGSGRLTRLDTAFSRDQEHKIYVQDRMRENAATLYEWLESGASFFVCGDASRMAKDVDQALHEIVQQQGNLSEADAKSYVKKLKDEGRYMRDVY